MRNVLGQQPLATRCSRQKFSPRLAPSYSPMPDEGFELYWEEMHKNMRKHHHATLPRHYRYFHGHGERPTEVILKVSVLSPRRVIGFRDPGVRTARALCRDRCLVMFVAQGSVTCVLESAIDAKSLTTCS